MCLDILASQCHSVHGLFLRQCFARVLDLEKIMHKKNLHASLPKKTTFLLTNLTPLYRLNLKLP